MSAGHAARATFDMTRMPGRRDRQGRHAAPWLGSACATALLLGSIMLAAGPGEAKPDNCTVNGSTVTCAGNQSAGIQSGRDFNSSNTSTLNVQNLSTDITPAGAVPGILVSNGTSTSTYFLNVLLGSRKISTSGAGAHGIIISGQGGTGGGGSNCNDPTAITCQAGGSGGTGGLARPPQVTFQGTVIATSQGSSSGPVTGIRAVGISGNGGNGGSSVCCNGGRGGTGGNGPTVLITTSGSQVGTLQITGDQSPGIFVLSQAGNGGNGGSSDLFGSGGSGGAGGVGGPVTVQGNWSVTTNGTTSPGISIASLGGTGGKGGDGSIFNPSSGSGGNTQGGGKLTINVSGSVQTQGPESYAIVAQSLGGRGGAGGSSNGLVSFGASGGSAGPGGLVQITNSAALTTRGEQSPAIVAQSIGGAGGAGGSGFAAFYGQGGGGSIGGAGGSISVVNTGPITTYGNDAHGIQAQSIGGTGGDGGSTGGIVALGGGGSATSNGSDITINNVSATIVTGLGPSGKPGPDPTCGTGCSHGIVAQSIGGGGGNGGSTGGWFTVGAQGRRRRQWRQRVDRGRQQLRHHAPAGFERPPRRRASAAAAAAAATVSRSGRALPLPSAGPAAKAARPSSSASPPGSAPP